MDAVESSDMCSTCNMNKMSDSDTGNQPLLEDDSIEQQETDNVIHEESSEFECDLEPIDRIRLNSMFEKVQFSDMESLMKSLNQIKFFLEKELIYSSSYTKKIILYTFERSLMDNNFALKAGALYGVIHIMTIEEESVRTILLNAIQKELEENCIVNRDRFVNAIFLLSELHYHLRMNGRPIFILSKDAFTYFPWLLTGNEREIEILAIGLIINGSELKKENPDSYRSLLVQIKFFLMARNLSPTSKCWLLLFMDLDSINFGVLHDDILMCHMMILGEKGAMKLKRMRPTNVIHDIKKSSLTNIHVELMTSHAHFVSEKGQSANNKFSQDEDTSPKSCSSNTKSPDGQSSYDMRLSPDCPLFEQLNITDQGNSPVELQQPTEQQKYTLQSPYQSSDECKSSDGEREIVKTNYSRNQPGRSGVRFQTPPYIGQMIFYRSRLADNSGKPENKE